MSAPEIDLNELALNAHLFAGEQLVAAAGSLALLLKMSSLRPEKVMDEHPILVVGFALLAHLDARAEENRCLMEAGIQTMQEIAEGVDMLCTLGFPPASQADIEHEEMPSQHEAEIMYSALKVDYERHNPCCSVEQHTVAIARFARLVGL